VRFSVLVDFNTETLEGAAENMALIRSITDEILVIVEDAAGLLLVHELRQFGIDVEAACLGRMERRLIAAAEPTKGAN
jgi:hypothetical protein